MERLHNVSGVIELKVNKMSYTDFKKGCELWTREEILESLYIFTQENKRLQTEISLYEENKRYLIKQIAKLKMKVEEYENKSNIFRQVH